MYYLCSENKGADHLRGYRELICVFVFAYAKIRFSHDEAHFIACDHHVLLSHFSHLLIVSDIWKPRPIKMQLFLMVSSYLLYKLSYLVMRKW